MHKFKVGDRVKVKWSETNIKGRGTIISIDENDMLFTIRDEIDNPNRDMAINQLEILARRGYFSLPTYTFKETHDDNGNPIWNCECHIEEEECYFDETSSSKKAAKKGAAYRMLIYVLGMEK